MSEGLFLFFYNFQGRHESLDSIIVFIGDILPFLILLVLGLFLLFHRDSDSKIKFFPRRSEAFVIFLTSFSALLVSEFFKNIFKIIRPFDIIPGVENLFVASGYAFPSGHATFFMALALAVYFYHKKIGLFLFISAILIGTFRVIAGVHYPIDILGGFVLGTLIAILFNYLFNKKDIN